MTTPLWWNCASYFPDVLSRLRPPFSRKVHETETGERSQMPKAGLSLAMSWPSGVHRKNRVSESVPYVVYPAFK